MIPPEPARAAVRRGGLWQRTSCRREGGRAEEEGGGGKGLKGRGPWGLRGRPAGLGWAALPAWSPPPPPARPPLTRRYPLRLGRYLLARIKDPQQKLEAQLFEEGKETTNGLHFLSIQSGPEADAPDGFWLLKDFETVGRS